MPNDLPAGTITFLFTDIEDSTHLWECYPDAMMVSLARHDDLLRQAIQSHHGHLVKTTGDGGYAVFSRVADAITAALEFQRALAAETWPELSPDKLRARTGLHTGEAELRHGDYHGTALNRAARIMSLGHGGQVLLSFSVAGIGRDNLPAEITFRDMGEHRLRGLARPERIYQLVAPGLADEFPPLHGATAKVISLPQLPTGFIGRWEEVGDILALFDQPGTRLVSLIGPGGMGKTRLAIQVASTAEERDPDRFPDGIFFVPLAPVNSGEGIVSAIAAAIGFQFSRQAGDSQRQLLAYLLSRSLLLILDNMEQLVATGGTGVTAAILDAAPDARLLVTSRSRLAIQGEQLYNVPGMRLPDPDVIMSWTDPEAEAAPFSGLGLFRQAAGRIRPDFRLTRNNISDVIRIGRQVQGMPLGIELAAGWLELLSPAEIAAEIDRNLDLLSTDLLGVPDRQRSMRAVFDTTWTLLNDRERSLIPALAVFRGPFTREAAAAVTGASLPDLLSLANKSWLQRVTGSDGASRFLVHELLRQYAEEKLQLDPAASEADVRYRFAEYYADGLVAAAPLLRGPQQLQARDQITADFVHIRNAWHWFLDRGDFDTLTERMLLPLYFYDEFHHHGTEFSLMVTAALARREKQKDPGGLDILYIKLRAALTTLTTNFLIAAVDLREHWTAIAAIPDPIRQLGFWYIGALGSLTWINLFDEASRRLREIIDAPLPPDQEWLRPAAAEALGTILLYTIASPEQTDEPVALLRRASETYYRAGDMVRYAMTLGNLASAYAKKRDFAQALALVEEQNSLLEPLRLGWYNWPRLGDLYLKTGQIDKMMAVYSAAWRQAYDAGELPMVGYALSWESIYALRFDTPEHARRARLQNMEMATKYGPLLEENITAWSYFELGEIERVTGDMQAAAEKYGSALAGFQSRNDLTGLAYYERGTGDLALAAGDAAKAARHYARALELLPATISYHGRALTLARLALAESALGDYDTAAEHILASLRIVDANGETDLGSHAVLAAGELALAGGRADTALALVASLATSPFTWNEVRAEARRLDTRARAVLDEPTAAAAEARGRELPLEEVQSRLIRLLAAASGDWPDGVIATGQSEDLYFE